jgi:predicted transcriptional regulator
MHKRITSAMWNDLIKHLAGKGLSQQAMAKAAGVHQSTISRIAGGLEPSYSVGMALIQLGGGIDALRVEGVAVPGVPAANDAHGAQAAQQSAG